MSRTSLLFIRNCGPVGYPSSAEVVKMQPPDALIQRGITSLPTIGDGRQSGTSASPSILNAAGGRGAVPRRYPQAGRGAALALTQRIADTTRS